MFRGSRLPSKEGTDAASGSREFFAFKAARFLGGAARQVGASIARLAAPQSVEALCSDTETKASGSSDVLAKGAVEWAPLLAAADDTPRYESSEGTALTFRAAFLSGRALEFALANASQEASGESTFVSKSGLSPAVWMSFLKGATFPGGDDIAARIPELLALTRSFPDCRMCVEGAVSIIKADVRHEQLRSARALAGTRAEEIRSELNSSKGLRQAPESARLSSAEAVKHYSLVRQGLFDASANLGSLLTTRKNCLEGARSTLQELAVSARVRLDVASARRAELQQRHLEATDAPRRAAEELERNDARRETDISVQTLEAERRRLQMELEQAAQELAARRDERLTLLRRRDEAVAAHRSGAESVERQLQELRPRQFFQLVSKRGDNMTEGEIVASLIRTADAAQDAAKSARECAQASAARRDAELANQAATIERQELATRREHIRYELKRLDATGAAMASAIQVLLDAVRVRDTRAAMGVLDEDDEFAVSLWADVQRLRAIVLAAEDTWEEILQQWGASEQSSTVEPTDIAALEASHAYIAECLEQLKQTDIALFDLVMGGDEASSSSHHTEHIDGAAGPQLPNGWTAHADGEGRLYYHNAVTNLTQWEIPLEDAALDAGWKLYSTDDGQVYYHNPNDGASLWWPELPTYPATPAAA